MARTLRTSVYVNSDRKWVTLVKNQSYLIPQLEKIFSLAALVSQMNKLSTLLRNPTHGSSLTTNQRGFTFMWVLQEGKFPEVRSKGSQLLVLSSKTLKF